MLHSSARKEGRPADLRGSSTENHHAEWSAIMRYHSLYALAMATGAVLSPSTGFAQDGQHSAGSGQHYHGVTLHVNPRWRECSFQLDPSLTQNAWHQFAAEAGLVAYFRPLTDARPMGAGKWEVSALQWGTAIDDEDAAWNDTFVHPDSTHYLFEGSALQFPGLMVRRGLTNRLDAGAYLTKSPGANYGFYGGQLQYNLHNDTERDWAAAARVSFVSMYGPEDLDLRVYGVDLVASKEFSSRWVSVSPYAGVSSYLSTAHEKTAAVALSDENVLGGQAMVGAVVQVSVVRLAAEYNTARVGTRSFKLGVAF